jgi:hypothetical protein
MRGEPENLGPGQINLLRGVSPMGNKSLACFMPCGGNKIANQTNTVSNELLTEHRTTDKCWPS